MLSCHAIRVLVLSAVCALSSACNEPPSAPRPLRAAPGASRLDAAATRTHREFTVTVDADFYLSCIDEVTHWQGTGDVTVDVERSPSGVTSTKIQGRSEVGTFSVTRADGTRYYMIGQGSTQRHELSGPVSEFTVTEPKVFRSESGDVLVTNYAYVIVFDQNGDPVTVHAVGACP